MGDLEEVANLAVNRVKENIGGYFSDSRLTYAAKNSGSFVNFANGVEHAISEYISDGGYIATLDEPAAENKLYKALLKDDLESTKFNTNYDGLHGLRILVNDVWAYELVCTQYYQNQVILSIDLKYTLYDYFGLDYSDIHKFDQVIFYVWFVLQHFRGYKPFITKMEIERTYRMIVPENWLEIK